MKRLTIQIHSAPQAAPSLPSTHLCIPSAISTTFIHHRLASLNDSLSLRQRTLALAVGSFWRLFGNCWFFSLPLPQAARGHPYTKTRSHAVSPDSYAERCNDMTFFNELDPHPRRRDGSDEVKFARLRKTHYCPGETGSPVV